MTEPTLDEMLAEIDTREGSRGPAPTDDPKVMHAVVIKAIQKVEKAARLDRDRAHVRVKTFEVA